MELTSGQEMALKAINEVGKSHPDGGGIVVISGYAGTGKTTILRTLSEGQSLLVLTPTGKAAMRVKEVCPSADASTIHRWMYEVSEDLDTGKLIHRIKDAIISPSNKTVFVDEASMVNFKMFRDLYGVCKSRNLNMVFIGDSFQLPPVETDESTKDFSVLASDFPAHYRVAMTEVVRQALDSPIIRASMAVRDQRNDLDCIGSLPVVAEHDLANQSVQTFENGGVTICHRNVTRHALNVDIRKVLGFGETVVKGEPLMVIFNNYTLDVFNGEIVNALSEPELVGSKPVPVTDRYANESLNMWFYKTHIDTPSGKAEVLFADREVFGTQGKINTKFIRKAGESYSRHLKIEECKRLGQPLSYSELKEMFGTPVLNCNFGYALSAHKSQGSEWSDVIVAIEPTIRIHSIEGRRWLYTALTRSRKSVKLCWL